MRVLLLGLLFLCSGFTLSGVPKPAEVRSLYNQAAVNRKSADKLLKLLTDADVDRTPVLLCYKGAAQMLQAKYAFSPISKLSWFKKGRNLIEEAIARNPEDLEMRYLRFTIQTNLPAVLGYSDDIQEDKQLLVNRVQMIKDEALRTEVQRYLSASKHCTPEDLKKLRK
ncbi:hypothetical protein [Pedobacter faecalis]|uniref:hypothetical protein n=1 Tax=Pedobacter faecalis TaxID=3041495 RepID=UPI00254D6FD8|nr:hypothetical protein [Pedobacter sp. ELA7]